MMMAGRGHPRQSYIAVRLGPRRSRAPCHPSNHPIYRAIVTSGGKPRHHDGTIKPWDGRYFAGKPSDGVMVYRLTGHVGGGHLLDRPLVVLGPCPLVSA